MIEILLPVSGISGVPEQKTRRYIKEVERQLLADHPEQDVEITRGHVSHPKVAAWPESVIPDVWHTLQAIKDTGAY